MLNVVDSRYLWSQILLKVESTAIHWLCWILLTSGTFQDCQFGASHLLCCLNFTITLSSHHHDEP